MSTHDRLIFVRGPKRDEDSLGRPHFSPNPTYAFMQRMFELAKQYERSQLTVYNQDQQIKNLSGRIAHLEALVEGKALKTGGEEVYEYLRPSLEELRGQFVAIDTESRQVAGTGSSLEEAYDNARKKFPDKDQFYFRKVGQKYLFRL